jgi:hypothetical protein
MNQVAFAISLWKNESLPLLSAGRGHDWAGAVRRCLVLILPVLLLAAGGMGQTPTAPEGVNSGNYNYQGSFEFGYRFVEPRGNGSVYDTFVNEQQGPRLLEQTLSMRSLNHEGILFDNLYWSSFGWGGDPENAGRLRVSKNQWYNFNFNFRRDRNFWDYNLLANPLNPVNPVLTVNQAPHRFETVRRIYDTNLVLLPQSKVRFRLGYTRNNMEGPSVSSVHEGTDTVLFQNWRTLLDGYQIGVDFKVLPRTNISYDQFLQYYRGDTTWTDQNFLFNLAGPVPVDAGVAWNPAANQPCATPLLPTGEYNPACNGFLAYSRSSPTRVSYPTEQLTLQSSYFHRLDLSARFSYSSAESKLSNIVEAFDGLSTRSRQRIIALTGLTAPASRAKRIVANVDFGATIQLTDRLRLVDSFRFSNFRIPGSWSLFTNSLFAATLLSTPNQFDPAACPPPFTAATCPQHNSSSGADITNDFLFTFLRQDSKMNTVELEYDLTPRITGHLGWRFERRSITNSAVDIQDLTFFPTLPNRGACAGQPLDANGVCRVTTVDGPDEPIPQITGHSLLLGFSARPTDALRTTFDLEWFAADHTLTRISPKNRQHYKGRISYHKDWMNLSGTVNVLESRNNVLDIGHKEHNRNYGFALIASPKDRLGAELGYNYNDIFSTTNICFVSTPTPPNSITCGTTTLLAADSIYKNRVHFVYGNLMFKPVKRVTANVGYNLTSTSGNTLILNPTQSTLGPLAFNYHKPTASLDVELAKGWTWRTGWNYYGYNEKSDPGVVLGRDFHSNSATLSLRYAF